MILSCAPVDQLVNTIKGNIPLENPDCFISIPSNCPIDLEKFRAQLKSENISFLGAIFPFVFDEEEAYEDKILVKFYKFAHPPIFFDKDCKGSTDLTMLDADCANSILLLSDPSHPHLSNFLVELFKTFGGNKKVAGGCTMLKENKLGCNLFDADRTYINYIALVPFLAQMQLSLHHGWTEISGPYIVTKTDNQIVEHLNWEPAKEVLAGAFPQLKGADFKSTELFDLVTEYPFGIYKELGECIVRDPIQFTETGIVFLTEIPENTVMFILEGKKKSLFSASVKAIEESLDINDQIEDHLIFNCIGRKMALKEEYIEELKCMREVSLDKKMEGVYTLGEIGTNPNGFLEINNRSCLSISFYK